MKYFYTCPIKAAYMAKYFGMRFVNENPKQGIDWAKDKILYYDADRYYIHSDSVHLLEPINGDEGVDAANRQCLFLEGKWQPCMGGNLKAIEPVAIDKRNGIAFMWPETENE